MSFRFSISDKYKNKDELSSIKAEISNHRVSTMAIMDFEGLGTEFYDEEEIERDEVIDPIWEAQQISTFTAWCNAHLRKANMKIECFEQDFRNGLKLMKLLEIISNETLPSPDKGKMRFHKIANVNKALKFVEEKGVKLACIGAEEIVDGNVKMTLGMVWTIILRFTIQDIMVEDSSAKEGLLLWCKRKTNGYKNVNIKNFKTSFQDGLGFCALIHNFDPSLIDFDSLTPKNRRRNLELAFDVAAKHFDVPQMLNVEDMVANNESDERSMMAYVSSYYHAFNKKDKMLTAVNKICSIVSERIKRENSTDDPHLLMSNLLSWIEKYIREFQKQPVLRDTSELEEKRGILEKFHAREKPDKITDRFQFEYASVLCPSKQMTEARDNVREKWNVLQHLEESFEEYVLNQSRRLDKIKSLVEKYWSCYGAHKSWMKEQVDKLTSRDYEWSTLGELRCLKREQETFLSAVGSKQTTSEKLVNIAKELRYLEYCEIEEVEEKLDDLITIWDSLERLHEERMDFIKKYYEALSEIDELQLEYAKRIIPLYNWVLQANVDLSDTLILHFVDEIQELTNAHDEFKQTLRDAQSEMKLIQSTNQKIVSIIKQLGLVKVPLNPYTTIQIHDLELSWKELESNVPRREKMLRESFERQRRILDVIEKYQVVSMKMSQKLEQVQTELLQVVEMSQKNNADLETLQDRFEQVNKELERVSRYIPDLKVFFEKMKEDCKEHEEHMKSLWELESWWNVLKDVSSRVKKWLGSNKQVGPVSRGTTTSQDYEDTFRYFDRTGSDCIDSRAFHACLLSLGFGLEDDKENDEYFNEILSKVDPEGSGHVTLHAFLQFMKHQDNNASSSTNHKHQDAEEDSAALQHALSVLANHQKLIEEGVLRDNLPVPVAEYCISKMRRPVTFTSGSDEQFDFSSLL